MNQQKVVKVYSTSTCPHCKGVKNFLNEKGLIFEEFNVLEDQNARKEMIDKSGQMGVPVIIVDDEIVIGFNRESLENKLGL